MANPEHLDILEQGVEVRRKLAPALARSVKEWLFLVPKRVVRLGLIPGR